MKRIILVAFLSFLAIRGLSQAMPEKNNLFGFFAGGGVSTTYNYDAGISGGVSFDKELGSKDFGHHNYIGGMLFYQGFNMLSDREQYGAKNGSGNAGVTLLNKSGYIFITPKFSHDFGRRGDDFYKHDFIKAYVDFGAGFKMSGTETLRKWDHDFGASYGDYDSVINTSKNMKSMVLRVGFGFTEYFHMGAHWMFTLTEDFGYVPGSITKTTDPKDPSRTYYTPHSLTPTYFSVQIGIAHSKL
jgi:hypothetical protein